MTIGFKNETASMIEAIDSSATTIRLLSIFDYPK